jgi:hypothetical protein
MQSRATNPNNGIAQGELHSTNRKMALSAISSAYREQRTQEQESDYETQKRGKTRERE